MADIAEMIYNYNPTGFYLKNSAQDLANDKMRMDNNRAAKIMSIEDQIANGDLSAWNKMQAYDPQRVQQKYLSDAEQLKLGSKWAGAFRTLAPENKARAYAQFIKAAPGMGIDVSDMPQSYIPEESDAFIEQLANAGIDETSRYSNEMAERRQQEAFAQQERMARLQNELAMQRQQALGEAGGAGGYGNTQAGLALRIAENPDNYTPEMVAWAMDYLKSGSSEVAYDRAYQGAMGRETAKNQAGTSNTKRNLERNLPAFEQMVDELVDLADKATYTYAGRVRDEILRQTGADMSEGAVAREKYQQIVNNELLPKLRETFGGQLSDGERQALLSTLGNVNLSPEEKKAAVQAFIEAKRRQLGTYEQAPANQELSVGTVEDGYRFKGGNPADKNNWEKVK